MFRKACLIVFGFAVLSVMASMVWVLLAMVWMLQAHAQPIVEPTLPAATPLYQSDDVAACFGDAQDACWEWDTAQTQDAYMLGLGASNTVIIGEKADMSVNRALGAQTNPTLYVHSADAATTTDMVYMTHNQTDGVVGTVGGDLKLDAAGGDVWCADPLSLPSGTKLNDAVIGKVTVEDASGGICVDASADGVVGLYDNDCATRATVDVGQIRLGSSTDNLITRNAAGKTTLQDASGGACIDYSTDAKFAILDDDCTSAGTLQVTNYTSMGTNNISINPGGTRVLLDDGILDLKNTNVVLYNCNTDDLCLAADGAAIATFNGTQILLAGDLATKSAGLVIWSSTTSPGGTPDLALERSAAGKLGITTGGATQAMTFDVSSATKGQILDRKLSTATLTFAANPGDASKTTSGLIPDGAGLRQMTGRVLTAGTNCTSVNIGDGTDVDLYAATLSVADATTFTNAQATASFANPLLAAGEVTVTAVGGNCYDLVIRVEAWYETASASTSD